MKSHITIRDIAKKLDLSVSTISRALSNHSTINEKTKALVIETAKAMNYQPNIVARNFRINKTHNIGVIVPDLVTHFFSATISGIQNETSQSGYNIMICQSNESYATECKNIETLISSRVDGLLISISKETEDFDHIKSIVNREIPIVLFDRVCDSIENISQVSVDDHDGAFYATEHLIKNGYERIAFISGPEKLSISQNRMRGYIDALAENNMAVREDFIINSTLTREDIIFQTQRLLSCYPRPDAIFAINDPTAILVMQVLKEMDIKIPDEVGLIGFNNEPVTSLLEPQLTTVEQPAYRIGQIAAKHIINQIDHPEDFVSQKVILKTKLIVRSSTKPKVILQ